MQEAEMSHVAMLPHSPYLPPDPALPMTCFHSVPKMLLPSGLVPELCGEGPFPKYGSVLQH